MAARKDEPSARERLASSIAASLPAEGGSYEISSMFSERTKRRILGSWEVFEHTVGGIPFLDAFMLKTLRGRELLDPVYSAIYEFKEGLCLKKVLIEGFLEQAEGEIPFRYVLNISLSWELEPEGIRVRPEMGYQYTSLDDEPAAIRELPRSLQWMRIALSATGDTMQLTEGEDLKKLARVPG